MTELSCFADGGEGATPLYPLTKAAWREGGGDLPSGAREVLEAAGFQASAGQYLPFSSEQGRVAWAIGLGDGEKQPTGPLDAALAAFGGLAMKLPEGSYRVAGEGLTGELALAWALGAYRFSHYKRPKRAPARLDTTALGHAAGRVETMARAVYLARDLINTPAGDLGPAGLEAAAKAVAEAAGASFAVTVGEDLLAANYPMIHTVGRAAAEAPRLIDVTWGAVEAPKVTLVGKGVTFDSGGLDLKPAAGMDLMKKDMGGAAQVLGAAQAIMALDLPIRLRVLIPAVENAVSGNAFHPRDVLTSRAGLTVEVGNTDAEGRLVLADAISEAVTEKPDLLVDFATLTGAARVALGTEVPALFSNADRVAEDFLAAGERVGDPLWRLPLWPGYRRLLSSDVADLSSTGNDRFGGAILAALFLESFVDHGVDWAHIDLMAWNNADRPGRPRGGEAMGLRALVAMLDARYGRA
jgi:leucyl aminopeptidase